MHTDTCQLVDKLMMHFCWCRSKHLQQAGNVCLVVAALLQLHINRRAQRSREAHASVDMVRVALTCSL